MMDSNVQALNTKLAAVLAYNDMTLQEGYIAVDLDEDGKISLKDLTAAAEALQINSSHETVEAWFVQCSGGSDFITQAQWVTALNKTSGEAALKSLGIDRGASGDNKPDRTSSNASSDDDTNKNQVVRQSSKDTAERNVTFAKQQILAVLAHNQMAIEDGFSTFDVDADGKITVDDLVKVDQFLNLGLQQQACADFLLALDRQGAGFLLLDDWTSGLKASEDEPPVDNQEQESSVSAVSSSHNGSATASLDTSSASDPEDEEEAPPAAGVAEQGGAERTAEAAAGKNADDDDASSVSDPTSPSSSSASDPEEDAETDAIVEENVDETKTAETQLVRQASKDTTERNVTFAKQQILAVLAHNQMAVEDAFSTFDVDADGKITVDDLVKVDQFLNLGLQQQACADFLLALDRQGAGFLLLDDWTSGLKASEDEPPVDNQEQESSVSAVSSSHNGSATASLDTSSASDPEDEEEAPPAASVAEQGGAERTAEAAAGKNADDDDASSVSDPEDEDEALPAAEQHAVGVDEEDKAAPEAAGDAEQDAGAQAAEQLAASVSEEAGTGQGAEAGAEENLDDTTPRTTDSEVQRREEQEALLARVGQLLADVNAERLESSSTPRTGSSSARLREQQEMQAAMEEHHAALTQQQQQPDAQEPQHEKQSSAASSSVPSSSASSASSPTLSLGPGDKKADDEAETLSESLRTLRAVMLHNELSVAECHQVLDEDEDGFISEEELVSAMGTLAHLSGAHARVLFTFLDQDGDGRLSLQDWTAVLAKVEEEGAGEEKVEEADAKVQEDEGGERLSDTPASSDVGEAGAGGGAGEERKEVAAVTLQTSTRTLLARRRMERRREEQRSEKLAAEQKRKEEEEEAAAAEEKAKQDAALKIQAQARGMAGRRAAERQAAEQRAQAVKREGAATKIQARARGAAGRQEAAQVRHRGGGGGQSGSGRGSAKAKAKAKAGGQSGTETAAAVKIQAMARGNAGRSKARRAGATRKEEEEDAQAKRKDEEKQLEKDDAVKVEMEEDYENEFEDDFEQEMDEDGEAWEAEKKPGEQEDKAKESEEVAGSERAEGRQGKVGEGASEEAAEDERKRKEAAVKIQALARGRETRKKSELTRGASTWRLGQQAAKNITKTIQARGRGARMESAEVAQSRVIKKQQREEAALRIQAVARGNAERDRIKREMRKRRESAVTDEELYKQLPMGMLGVGAPIAEDEADEAGDGEEYGAEDFEEEEEEEYVDEFESEEPEGGEERAGRGESEAEGHEGKGDLEARPRSRGGVQSRRGAKPIHVEVEQPAPVRPEQLEEEGEGVVDQQLRVMEEDWVMAKRRRAIFKYACQQMVQSIVHDIVGDVVDQTEAEHLEREQRQQRLEMEAHRGYRKLRVVDEIPILLREVLSAEEQRRHKEAMRQVVKMQRRAQELRARERSERREREKEHAEERAEYVAWRQARDDALYEKREKAVAEKKAAVQKRREQERVRRRQAQELVQQVEAEQVAAAQAEMVAQVAQDVHRQQQQHFAAEKNRRMDKQREMLRDLSLKAAKKRMKAERKAAQQFAALKKAHDDRFLDLRHKRAAKRDQTLAVYQAALKSADPADGVKDPNQSLRFAIGTYFSAPDSSVVRTETRHMMRDLLFSDAAPTRGMSVKQIEQRLRQVFLWMDREGTGQVQMAELGRALEQMGVKVNGREVERLYKQMDTDGDGLLSLEEFERFGRMLVSENRDVSGAKKGHTIAEVEVKREVLNAEERRERARQAREDEDRKKREEVLGRRRAWQQRREFVEEAAKAYDEQLQVEVAAKRAMLSELVEEEEKKRQRKEQHLLARWQAMEREEAAVQAQRAAAAPEIRNAVLEMQRTAAAAQQRQRERSHVFKTEQWLTASFLTKSLEAPRPLASKGYPVVGAPAGSGSRAMASLSAIYMGRPRTSSPLAMSFSSPSDPSLPSSPPASNLADSSSRALYTPLSLSGTPVEREGAGRSPGEEARRAFVLFGSKSLTAGRSVNLTRFRKMCAKYLLAPQLLSEDDVDAVFLQAQTRSDGEAGEVGDYGELDEEQFAIAVELLAQWSGMPFSDYSASGDLGSMDFSLSGSGTFSQSHLLRASRTPASPPEGSRLDPLSASASNDSLPSLLPTTPLLLRPLPTSKRQFLDLRRQMHVTSPMPTSVRRPRSTPPFLQQLPLPLVPSPQRTASAAGAFAMEEPIAEARAGDGAASDDADGGYGEDDWETAEDNVDDVAPATAGADRSSGSGLGPAGPGRSGEFQVGPGPDLPADWAAVARPSSKSSSRRSSGRSARAGAGEGERRASDEGYRAGEVNAERPGSGSGSGSVGPGPADSERAEADPEVQALPPPWAATERPISQGGTRRGDSGGSRRGGAARGLPRPSASPSAPGRSRPGPASVQRSSSSGGSGRLAAQASESVPETPSAVVPPEPQRQSSAKKFNFKFGGRSTAAKDEAGGGGGGFSRASSFRLGQGVGRVGSAASSSAQRVGSSGGRYASDSFEDGELTGSELIGSGHSSHEAVGTGAASGPARPEGRSIPQMAEPAPAPGFADPAGVPVQALPATEETATEETATEETATEETATGSDGWQAPSAHAAPGEGGEEARSDARAAEEGAEGSNAQASRAAPKTFNFKFKARGR